MLVKGFVQFELEGTSVAAYLYWLDWYDVLLDVVSFVLSGTYQLILFRHVPMLFSIETQKSLS